MRRIVGEGIGSARVLLAASAVAALALAGCADMPQRALAEEAAPGSAGFGRAFGRVEYVEGGTPVTWSSSLFATDSLTLFVRPASGGEMQYMDIEGDGAFSWALRPGDYEIVGFQVTRKRGTLERLTSRLMAAFPVRQAGQATYIGDLRIQASGPQGDRVDIVDRYDEALQRHGGRLAQGGFDPVKGLMRPEGRIGSYTRVAPICSWELNCNRQFRGLQPLRPEGTAEGMPVTRDRRPLLEWKPASKRGVTYDVAIFESLSFMYGANGNVRRLRGRLVAYAEGLTTPQFLPADPLPAGQKFEWTVRLRDGDAVSTWSSTHSAWFAVVAWSRTSGQHFGFETPAR